MRGKIYYYRKIQQITPSSRRSQRNAAHNTNIQKNKINKCIRDVEREVSNLKPDYITPLFFYGRHSVKPVRNRVIKIMRELDDMKQCFLLLDILSEKVRTMR